MTVQNIPRIATFTGDSFSTLFRFAFRIFTPADFSVTLTTGGVPVTLIQGVDYNFTVHKNQNVNPGGTITYPRTPTSGSPITAGQTLTVNGVLAFTQTVDLQQNESFAPNIVEDMVDRNTILAQQVLSYKFVPLDGSVPMLGNLQMGGFKVTGMAAGTAATDAMNLGQVAASSGSSLVGFIQQGTGAVARTVQDKDRESVSPMDFGAVGDGTTDDTLALQRAFDAAAGKRIEISRRHRLTVTGITVSSNTYVVFTQQGQLELLPYNTDTYQILRLHDVSNVVIENPYVNGRRDLNSFVGGEFGMGISIRGTTGKITIRNATTINCWGDGIYIGANVQNWCDDVHIVNHFADNNRRQGMSVVSVKRLVVDDPVWQNTNGTAPQSGLDIEPNSNTQFLDYIRINNPKTINNASGNGILISMGAMSGGTGRVIDIKVNNHQDVGSNSAMQCLNYDPTSGNLTGVIEFVSPVWKQSLFNGCTFREWGYGPLKAYVRNPVIIDNNQSASGSAVFNSSVLVYRDAASVKTYLMGGITFTNPTIKCPNTTVANSFYLRDLTAANSILQDITIQEVGEIAPMNLILSSNALVRVLDNDLNDRLSFTFASTQNLSYGAYAPLFKSNRTTLNVFQLPAGALAGQSSVIVDNINTGQLRITPPTGGNFVGLPVNQTYTSAASAGHRIKLTPLGSNVWRIDLAAGVWTTP